MIRQLLRLQSLPMLGLTKRDVWRAKETAQIAVDNLLNSITGATDNTKQDGSAACVATPNSVAQGWVVVVGV